MKLNKVKALSLAAALTAASGANAVIDVATATTAPVSFASELQSLDANGRQIVANSGNALDVKGTAGFATPDGTTRYVRFDLTDAVFDANPTLAVDDSTNNTVGNGSATETLLSGGDDQTFAIFSVIPANTKAIATTDQWLLTGSQYASNPAATSTLTYKLYETAGDATNQTQPLVTQTTPFVAVTAGTTPTLAMNAADLTATVASGFGEFAAPANISAAASGTLGSLGLLDVSDLLPATVLKKPGAGAGGDTVVNDFITAANKITITGDVSVGTFTGSTAAACTGGTDIACTKATDNASCEISLTLAQSRADVYFCVSLAADDVIGKGSYSAAMSVNTDITGPIGSIKYDTTTVEVPYITTYEGYNQRIFIDNRGATAAYYSTTFTSESGVTATAGASGSGTLPANTMTTVKVADLVTLTGGTRGSATMEIEAQSSSIFVTSQIVDLGTGVTDTQSLHPADNSVGSCTQTISASNPTIAAIAVAGAGDAATATRTAYDSAYAYSTCTD